MPAYKYFIHRKIAEMSETPQFFKTNDMGLAAYLTMNGHSCQGTDWQEKTCFWLFLLLPDLSRLVKLWTNRTASVEPVAYNVAFGAIKRELLVALHGVRDSEVSDK